ncbi:MAG: LysR family transcriptional regulator [Myxococcota bacterium]
MFDELATFVRIAERGSITAAARDLGVTQATASRRLQALEARLGVPLARRTTHTLQLTNVGRDALAQARALLASWDTLNELASDEAGTLRGHITLVAPVALGQGPLARATADFVVHAPEVTVHWHLRDGDMDFVTSGADLWVKVGSVSDPRLFVREACRVERIVVGTPSHAVARQPEELESRPFVTMAEFEDTSLALTCGDEMRRIFVRSAWRTTDILAGLEAVRRGVGLAVMPRWLVADDLASGGLVDVLGGWRAPTLAVHVARLPGRAPFRVRTLEGALLSTLAGLSPGNTTPLTG